MSEEGGRAYFASFHVSLVLTRLTFLDPDQALCTCAAKQVCLLVIALSGAEL